MAGFTDYHTHDGLGLAALVRDGKVTAVELVEAAIARIEALDGPINAVVHRQYERARREAASGLPAGPFHGVPFLLKDLYALDTGEPSQNGSRFFDGFVADHESEIVARFRRAGLAILGRSNSPELGLAPTTEPVRFGPTRNPWNTAHSAGGSSGGSAAAVALGMVPLAHATDGGGSIRIPAACCGLVGLKPSRARNPSGPDVGEGWAGLAAGHVVSRTVRDTAAALDVTAGPAPGDPYACPPAARPFLAEVGADPGRLRIAVSTAVGAEVAVHADCKAAVEAAARLCEGLGHAVEAADPPIDHGEASDALGTIIAGNIANTVGLRERARGKPVAAGELERASARLVEAGRRLSAEDYARAVLRVHQLGRRMGAFLERYDVLLTPTLSRPPAALGEIDMMLDDADAYLRSILGYIPFTPIENMAGLPAMSLPLHWNAAGLPIGVQIVARFGDEATLIRLAAQLEGARPWRDRTPPGW